MARSRNIKPSIMDNEELAELGPFHRLMFIYLWMLADREGRLEDRVKRISAQAFPYDEVNANEILNDLQDSGFIKRYESCGIKVISIVNFLRHQSPHGTEKDSELPCESGTYTKYKRSSNGYASNDKQIINCDGEVVEQWANGVLTVKEHPDIRIPDIRIPDTGFPLTDLLGDAAPEQEECAEPQSDSSPEVIRMPITGNKEFPILQIHVDEWSIAYPAVDIIRQLAAMRQWCLANPTRKKTARGVLSFCNAWLAREQDKPRATPPHMSAKPAKFDPVEYVNRNRMKQDDRIIDIN